MGQFEVKDIVVLTNPFGVDGLHQGEDIVLKYPTEDDLGGGLAVMSGIMYPFAKFIL